MNQPRFKEGDRVAVWSPYTLEVDMSKLGTVLRYEKGDPIVRLDVMPLSELMYTEALLIKIARRTIEPVKPQAEEPSQEFFSHYEMPDRPQDVIVAHAITPQTGFSITFMGSSIKDPIGKLSIGDDGLKFEGDADECAREFFGFLKSYIDGYVKGKLEEREKSLNRLGCIVISDKRFGEYTADQLAYFLELPKLIEERWKAHEAEVKRTLLVNGVDPEIIYDAYHNASIILNDVIRKQAKVT